MDHPRTNFPPQLEIPARSLNLPSGLPSETPIPETDTTSEPRLVKERLSGQETVETTTPYVPSVQMAKIVMVGAQ